MAAPLDPMHVAYASASSVGLLLTVWAMLNGSVRGVRGWNELKAPPAAFNLPVVGAALFAFGAVGYLLTKYSHLATISVALTAAVAGALGWTGMTVLMAKWALRGPLNDPHEELEELQGSIATVTRPIGEDTLGEIAYVFRGQSLNASARSIDGAAVPVGTEVVIEKIEDGIADVELWSIVEQRI